MAGFVKTAGLGFWFILLLSFSGLSAAAGEALYAEFNQFCIENFGAQHEPLVYQTFGSGLAFKESGFWVHESRNSAAVGFETNLPAKTFVEYGTTTSYGQSTAQPERWFYLHLHYLTGLQPETIYHYRLVAIDERGIRINSPDKNFSTHTFSGAILVPGGLSGPPYVLDQPNKVYILTQDIDSQTRGITIAAANVTVDLNGYTITYDQGTPLVSGHWDDYMYSDSSTFGIFGTYGSEGCRILNGAIIQGANNGAGEGGVGFNPIMGIYNTVAEVAGITADYSGDSISGIENHGGPIGAHHNIVLDRGTVVGDRHAGVKVIYGGSILDSGIHHNLIKRCRDQGIVNPLDKVNPASGGPIYSNEIYLDSYVINSFGIIPTPSVHDNKIFGTGYHPIAIGFANGINVSDNFIFLQGMAPNDRDGEYATSSSMNGIRLTQWGGETAAYVNNVYDGNTIIVKGRNGTKYVRGVQFSSDPYVSNLRFSNNIIKAEAQDSQTGGVPQTTEVECVSGQGLSPRSSTQLPVYYEDNLMITNSWHINLGDEYGLGGNHIFRNNTFRRFGSRADYHTIHIGYYDYNSYGNRLIDTAVEGGADVEDNSFDGTGQRDYSVGHSLQVVALSAPGVPIANTLLEVWDDTGLSYNITTDGQGKVRLELIEYAYVAPENVPAATKIVHQNHNLKIDGFNAYEVSGELFAIRNNAGAPVSLVFTPSGQVPSPSPAPSPSASPSPSPSVSPTPSPSPQACSPVNSTQNCTVGGCNGTQTCSGGFWSACIKFNLCCGVNCDDGNACTTDSCSGGVCSHSGSCPTGGSPGGGGYTGGSSGGFPQATPSPTPRPTVMPSPTPTTPPVRFVSVPETNDEIEDALLELPPDDFETRQVQQIIAEAKNLEKQGKWDQARAMWAKAKDKVAGLLAKARANKASYNYWIAGLAALALVGGAVYYSSTLRPPTSKPPIAGL